MTPLVISLYCDILVFCVLLIACLLLVNEGKTTVQKAAGHSLPLQPQEGEMKSMISLLRTGKASRLLRDRMRYNSRASCFPNVLWNQRGLSACSLAIKSSNIWPKHLNVNKTVFSRCTHYQKIGQLGTNSYFIPKLSPGTSTSHSDSVGFGSAIWKWKRVEQTTSRAWLVQTPSNPSARFVWNTRNQKKEIMYLSVNY